LFRIYANLNEYVLNLFENMHTAGLLHTASLLDSRTLPRALPDNCTLPRTLPHTAALPDKTGRSAAYCRTLHEFECRKHSQMKVLYRQI